MECVRRSWLLGELGAVLDYRARDTGRLFEILKLEDQELIGALAGRRRDRLAAEWGEFERSTTGGQTICRHSDPWPQALTGWAGAPRMLHLACSPELRTPLFAEPAVALVGSRRATDYGVSMARTIAQGLAASGVAVIAPFAEGVGAAALTGAIEAGRPAIATMAGGVDVCTPAARRGLYERILARGLAIAELPRGAPVRRWCDPARGRILAGLANLTIVVEAESSPRDLAAARVAQALGRSVAALPGRVTSSLSQGPLRLLVEGVPPVRGAADALDLLCITDARRAESGARAAVDGKARADVTQNREPPATALEPRLRAVLEQVGTGIDTAAKLAASSPDPAQALLALSELELLGVLGRGDGGRYVPRRVP